MVESLTFDYDIDPETVPVARCFGPEWLAEVDAMISDIQHEEQMRLITRFITACEVVMEACVEYPDMPADEALAAWGDKRGLAFLDTHK